MTVWLVSHHVVVVVVVELLLLLLLPGIVVVVVVVSLLLLLFWLLLLLLLLSWGKTQRHSLAFRRILCSSASCKLYACNILNAFPFLLTLSLTHSLSLSLSLLSLSLSLFYPITYLNNMLQEIFFLIIVCRKDIQ